MNFTHIVWDFNGTILNDVEVGIKSINVLLGRRGLKTINSVEEYQKVFCFPIIRYYENLGFDFNKDSFDDLAMEWVEQYMANSVSAKLYDGIPEALRMVRKMKVKQIVMSATEKRMLEGQLQSLGIIEYFDDILGLDNIYAYSKIELAKRWADAEKPERALLIGDTLHDYDTAKAANFECVLLSWGHQSKSALLKSGAAVFASVSEMTDELFR